MASPSHPSLFQQFVRTEAAGGMVLLAAAVVAFAVANSPLAGAAEAFWTTPRVVGPAGHALTLTTRGWVNDALMALFFLLVGLEIKRELLVGELATARQAALPIAAALGGVIAPALVYLALAPDGAGRGWAVPTATDIAFALAVLSIAASAAPPGLKVFLAALAIVDDMAAVLVIALVYTARVHTGALLTAAAIVVMLIGCNRIGVRRLWPYLTLGAALWLFVHESGVHATIAGVLLAMTIPAGAPGSGPPRRAPADLDHTAPLLRLEHALQGPSAFVVMPVFALANAGVTLGAADAGGGVSLAVAAGLLAGKPIGITAAAWLACRGRLASLPARVTWPMLHGVAWVAGIGFTMALFIAALAFGDGAAYAAAQAGILGGSAIAAAIGTVLLRRAVGRAPS
ncbi:MAG: Na+/H+ antiporter NhaA [Candidatus Binatia bacterium]